MRPAPGPANRIDRTVGHCMTVLRVVLLAAAMFGLGYLAGAS